MVAKKELLKKKLTEKRMEILLQVIEEEVNAAWGEIEVLTEQDYGDDYGGGSGGYGGYTDSNDSAGYTGARKLIDPENLIGTLLSVPIGIKNAVTKGVSKMGAQLIGMAGMLIGGTLSGLLPFNSDVGRKITSYYHGWQKHALRGIEHQFAAETAEINRGWSTFKDDFWGIGFIASPMNAIAAALVAEKSLNVGMSALNTVTGGAAQLALENFLNSPEVFDTSSHGRYYEAVDPLNKESEKVPEDLPSQLKMLEKVRKEKPELVKKFLDDLLKNSDLKKKADEWTEEELPKAMSGIVKDMNDAITSGKVGAVTPKEIATYKSQVGDIIKKTFEQASKEGKFKVEPPSSALDKTIAAVEGITKSMPAAQAKPAAPVAPQEKPAANNRRPASQPK